MYATPKQPSTRPVPPALNVDLRDAPSALYHDAMRAVAILDTLSAAQMRALSTPDLRKLESLCWHWASLSENELNERRRASREEESE